MVNQIWWETRGEVVHGNCGGNNCGETRTEVQVFEKQYILINIAICMNHLSSNYDEYLPPPPLFFCLTNIVIITIFTVLIAIIHEARFSLRGMPSRKEKFATEHHRKFSMASLPSSLSYLC